MSLKKHRPPDDARTQFVTVETISTAVMAAIALAVTALAHAAIFGAVLLLFAGMALGHALAITLGLAHPPGDDEGRGPRR
jgi:Na+/proline symporter